MSAAMSIPNGCVIGLAEEIAQAIARCEYGPKKNRLAVLAWSSFKQAGWQQGPEAGLRYFFDMEAICQELHSTRRSVANMRRQLEKDGLFTYHPNQQNYQTGWIVWKTAYHEWSRLHADAPHYGGKRAGAGNPTWIETARRTRLESTEQEPLSSGVRQLGEVENPFSSGVRPVDELLSSSVRQLGKTAIKWCPPASYEAALPLPAIVEPKKGTEERDVEEKRRIAPSARTSNFDVHDVDDFVDNQQEEKDHDALAAQREREVKDTRLEMHEKERKIRRMERASLFGPYLKQLQREVEQHRLWLSEHPLLDSSDSHAPGDASYQPGADDEPPSASLYESGPAPEQAYDEVDAPFYEGPETPADDSADACGADALFPEAIPPEKEDWFGTVGSWFFDMEHVDNRDKTQLAIALGKIKKRGYNDLWDVERRFKRWRVAYSDLKRAGVMHFANNLQKV